MSNLKRKDAPGGNPPSKSAKNTKEARPSKKDTSSKDAKAAAKSPKPKTSSAEVPAKAPVTSVLKDEEPMFPRGGGSVLTPLEQKQIQLEAKADAIRDEEFNTGGKALKKKKRKSALKSEKKGDKKAAQDEEDNIRVESLSFKVGYDTGPSPGSLLTSANSDWSRALSSSDRSHGSTASISKSPSPTT